MKARRGTLVLKRLSQLEYRSEVSGAGGMHRLLDKQPCSSRTHVCAAGTVLEGAVGTSGRCKHSGSSSAATHPRRRVLLMRPLLGHSRVRGRRIERAVLLLALNVAERVEGLHDARHGHRLANKGTRSQRRPPVQRRRRVVTGAAQHLSRQDRCSTKGVIVGRRRRCACAPCEMRSHPKSP